MEYEKALKTYLLEEEKYITSMHVEAETLKCNPNAIA